VTQNPLTDVRSRAKERIVGRQDELELVVATVAAGRDLLLEGPPGTSKSTLLRVVAEEWGIPLVFVEANADLTPAKLIGHHDPARVLREDYRPENFVDGPLVDAMRRGGFLYIEELNRAPEDTVNALLTSMAEREVAVPRVGRIAAAPTFRVVATMNPFDNVGTYRLSTSIHDRFCRLSLSYQDEGDEQAIVRLRAFPGAESVPEALVADAVSLTRATRSHPDIRQGSSVRGAIDLALIASELVSLRGLQPGPERLGPERPQGSGYEETVFDAMVLALSGRIHLDETAEVTPEQVLREIWEEHFTLNPATAAPG
jgi:MoxR-like ATPase